MINALYQFLENNQKPLHEIADKIWENPEIGYHETFACATVCDFLKARGFSVQIPFVGIDTAFKAEFQNGDGPTFAFCSEYDALAGLGHGCGHNLICACGLGAFLAAADYMKAHDIHGKVVLLGTPAEESFGGKVKMEEAGCLNGIDAVVMAHPGKDFAHDSGHSAVIGYEVTFHGKAAHAGASPWKGVNALDATMLLFAAINAYRQQMPPSAIIHGIVTNGGDAPNIIPETSTSRTYLRSTVEELLEPLQKRFLDMVKGAELMTGTTAEISVFHVLYRAAKPNNVMNKEYTKLVKALGEEVLTPTTTGRGSTDFSNFTRVIPGCHFNFAIAPETCASLPGHSIEFKAAAHSDYGFAKMLKAAAAMAAIGIRYLGDQQFRDDVNADFTLVK
jgi:amidohydrolase